MTARAWTFSSFLVEARKALSSLASPGADPVGGGGAEHLLGLALELRLGEPDGDHRGEAFEGAGSFSNGV